MGIIVTEDEADKRTRGIREERQRVASQGGSRAIEEMAAREMELSRTAIKNADPSKAYRLASTSQKGRTGTLRGLGYKITPLKDPAQLVTGEAVDGGQQHGDLVLMETSVENHERRRAHRQKRQHEIEGSQAEASREKINRIARDNGLVGPHKEAAFDESREA